MVHHLGKDFPEQLFVDNRSGLTNSKSRDSSHFQTKVACPRMFTVSIIYNFVIIEKHHSDVHRNYLHNSCKIIQCQKTVITLGMKHDFTCNRCFYRFRLFFPSRFPKDHTFFLLHLPLWSFLWMSTVRQAELYLTSTRQSRKGVLTIYLFCLYMLGKWGRK